MPAVNGKHVWKALEDKMSIVLAANTRNPLPVPGILKAADELDAVVAFELSKREIYLTNIEGLYPEGDHSLSGMTPKSYAEIVREYAKDYPDVPYFLHGDHIQVKSLSTQQIWEAQDLIRLEIEAGFTSFGMDPSFLPLDQNVALIIALARSIVENNLGLEVELGEITREKEYTTVAEATEYIGKLKEGGIDPDLLAINNGSKHGNYEPGEEVKVASSRTKEVSDASDMRIAQHGITGTPLDQIEEFADAGVLKGNVGTLWQNVLLDSVEGLEEKYEAWVEERKEELGLEELGIAYANAVFFEETMNYSDDVKEKITEAAYEKAKELLIAFRSQGTGSIVKDHIDRL